MKKVLIFLGILIIANISFTEEAKLENINQNNVLYTETVTTKPQKVVLDVKSVYDSLNIKGKIDYSIFQKAYLGYVQIPNKNPGVLVIIDYTKPSNEERFYVLDLNKKKLIYSTRVAHSKNSGLEIPLEFSDDPNSYQSSLGFFLTLGEYNGAYGYSLRLKGLEENINANAESRAIVIHGGDIVNDEYIKKFGFAGRSLGCPVLPTALTKEIVNYIKQGRVLFIHGNDEEYIEESSYLSKLAPIFEGRPQNVVEIEKPIENPKTVITTTISAPLNSPSITNNTKVFNTDQKNISMILDAVKKESEYKQNINFKKKEKAIDYLAIMKNVIADNTNSTTIKNTNFEKNNSIQNLNKLKENNISEKNIEKNETPAINKSQNIEETKEEAKEVKRKYPEEVTKKSLGLGVKLKSKSK